MGQQVNVYKSLNFYDSIGFKTQTITAPTQWFTEQSENKQYPLGTKLEVEDMIFRYAHIGALSKVIYRTRGQLNLGKFPINGPGHLEGDTMTAASADAKRVTIHLIAADTTYLTAQSATVAANEYEGGRIAIFPSTFTGLVCGRVKSNTALSGSDVTFSLKEGIEATCGGASTSKLFWNQYAYIGAHDNTVWGAQRNTAFMGITKVNATVDYYVWLQTWGPCLGQYGGVLKPGEDLDKRDVWFDRAGGLLVSGATEVGHPYQRAGFVIPGCYTNTDTHAGWAPLIMLQISP